MGKDDVVNQKTKNIRLYVKRVFISDDFDGELVRDDSLGWSFKKSVLLFCIDNLISAFVMFGAL